jgi:hypothetical protein
MMFAESSCSMFCSMNVEICVISPRPMVPSAGVPAISCRKRTQRVQWMQRVMSVETSGPRFSSLKTRLRSA